MLGDIPSLREVWSDAATFVHPADDRALADAIRRLIEHEDERADAAARAQCRAARFSLARFGRAYADLYAELLEGPASVLQRAPLGVLAG